ncbi:MAG TPA: UPF0175 family protein, partial [Chthoniobacteraceae bacterium]|nr:UPF0175 family protein [Chthoniobacteraceae bacterium]
LEVPDQFAKRFRLDEAAHSRELLEAFVLKRYAEGALSAGQVGQALGLSFFATEKFLHDHSAPGLGVEEQLEGLANLRKLGTR